MKKALLFMLIVVIGILMIATFTLSGCKTKTAAETTAVQTTVAETTAAQTTVAETTAAETVKDEIDPWILEVRKGIDKYRGEIDPSFKGPDGQTPSWDTELVLTVSEVEKIKLGNYKVTFNMDGSQGEYHVAMIKGIQDACDHLGMELVSVTDAGFDPTKQKSDIETSLALKPDIIISAPVDKISAAEAFRPAVEAGVKLVFWSNQPEGYVYGKDFVGISTSMPYDQGVFMAQELGKIVGDDAKIGIIYYDQDFWITNYIDDVVRAKLKELYPKIEVVADEGFAAVNDAEKVAGSIIQKNPDIKGFYVSFNFPAQLTAAACKDAGRDDIKIVTQGVDAPVLIKLLTPGDNIVAVITDTPYLIGVNHVLVGAIAMLGKDAPQYTLSPSAWYTSDNVEELWDIAMRIPLPQDVKDMLK